MFPRQSLGAARDGGGQNPGRAQGLAEFSSFLSPEVDLGKKAREGCEGGAPGLSPHHPRRPVQMGGGPPRRRETKQLPQNLQAQTALNIGEVPKQWPSDFSLT